MKSSYNGKSPTEHNFFTSRDHSLKYIHRKELGYIISRTRVCLFCVCGMLVSLVNKGHRSMQTTVKEIAYDQMSGIFPEKKSNKIVLLK